MMGKLWENDGNMLVNDGIFMENHGTRGVYGKMKLGFMVVDSVLIVFWTAYCLYLFWFVSMGKMDDG